MYIGHIESSTQNVVELRDSTDAKHWPRAIKTELEGHLAIGTFSNESIPQEVNVISAK